MKKLLSLVFVFLLINTVSSQKGKVQFKGEIANKNSELIYIKDARNKSIAEIKVDKNGKFEAAITIENPNIYTFFDGTEYTSLFLKDGYDLYLKMDAKQFDESIVYTGKGAKENNFLAQEILNQAQFNPEKFLELDEIALDKFLQKKELENIEKLKKNDIDSKLIELKIKDIQEEGEYIKGLYLQKINNKKLLNTVSQSFDYENHKGGKTKLEDLKGKYVYIDIWATWCGPCRAEIPHLQKIEKKYHDKNIEFVSISVDTKKDYDKWKKFVNDKQLGGIQLFADNDWNSDFVKAYGINGIPRFILLDPNGKIVNPDADRPSSEAIIAKLDELLN